MNIEVITTHYDTQLKRIKFSLKNSINHLIILPLMLFIRV